MFDANIHNIKKFTLSELKELENSGTGLKFYTRDIHIENEDGKVFSLTLFADKKEVLQVEVTTKELV